MVHYDCRAVGETWSRDSLASAPRNIWRYAPMLPVKDPANIVTLGEGLTPLLHAKRLGEKLGIPHLWVKDEGMNPTGSFKARGLSVAVSMAKELGIRKLVIPSAGNAASAMSAYAALAGMEAYVFVPRDVPKSNMIECQSFGAHVRLVDGLIHDCARIVAEQKNAEDWFEMTTLKEPYRVEGKKTMGYELAEQLNWTLPDAIFYPAGGGVGLIAMWKAFQEMEQLGWITRKRPKMIAVQALGCHPIVRALQDGTATSSFFSEAKTVAGGLRVPKPLGDFIMLQVIRQSCGTAIAVGDDDMLSCGLQLARLEGIFACPEGGACIAAVRALVGSGFLKPDAQIVVYNTGSGLKYLEAYSQALTSDGLKGTTTRVIQATTNFEKKELS